MNKTQKEIERLLKKLNAIPFGKHWEYQELKDFLEKTKDVRSVFHKTPQGGK